MRTFGLIAFMQRFLLSCYRVYILYSIYLQLIHSFLPIFVPSSTCRFNRLLGPDSLQFLRVVITVNVTSIYLTFRLVLLDDPHILSTKTFRPRCSIIKCPPLPHLLSPTPYPRRSRSSMLRATIGLFFWSASWTLSRLKDSGDILMVRPQLQFWTQTLQML